MMQIQKAAKARTNDYGSDDCTAPKDNELWDDTNKNGDQYYSANQPDHGRANNNFPLGSDYHRRPNTRHRRLESRNTRGERRNHEGDKGGGMSAWCRR